MTEEGTGKTILRVRELEVRYKAQRLHLPFEGSLDEAASVAKLAEDFLRDITTDAVLVAPPDQEAAAAGHP